MLYFLFFCSGISGLIYQVVWVREFGNAFGNTLDSASLVVAIFMLGLGAGSFLVGGWADRQYETTESTGTVENRRVGALGGKRPRVSLLRAYAYVELLIALLGCAISLTLPALGALSGRLSTYVRDANGWFVLSAMSHVARGAIAFGLLAPITMLMGGTLSLLVRHRVRHDLHAAGWEIAALYAVNTAGAAAGAFLTDFLFVPSLGLRGTQMAAVALNLVAGAGALGLASLARVANSHIAAPGFTPPDSRTRRDRASARQQRSSLVRKSTGTLSATNTPTAGSSVETNHHQAGRRAVPWTAVALALSGFAGLGVEILWLRHFTILLGGFRAVFSLLLTVMLVGIGAGSLAGGFIGRRFPPAQALMIVQSLFVVTVLAGLGSASVAAVARDSETLRTAFLTSAPFARWLIELWHDVRPILWEAGPPSILMGCTFPLANSLVQRAELEVGHRAGALYLANTAGAVCGSLVTGYLLLPRFGTERSATSLAFAAALAIAPLVAADRSRDAESPSGSAARRRMRTLAVSSLIAATALTIWIRLPADFVLRQSLAPLSNGERLLTASEGATETIVVTEVTGRGRGLITNGHPMSSTAPLDQRYMRALAHIPLLSMDRPSSVLVIGFGAGNSTHAATLHPSIERVEVADLSRHVLEHAPYFRDVNGDILHDRKVAVYVNDGRQHLQMQPEGAYDLITLEPPPIAHAGVAALYSREFYALARTRLKPGGYLSQWLPAYQVPADTALAMVRAFEDAFPQSVLLSGMHAELLLVGTTGAKIEIDPDRLASALADAPAVSADLRRLDLGTPTEIIGTFVASADDLMRATRDSPAVSDDRPLQEYVIASGLGSVSQGVPASLFDVASVAAWCPRCFDDDHPRRSVSELDTYLALLDQAYHATAAERASGQERRRTLLGSAYLGAVVPDTDRVEHLLGTALAEKGRIAEAIEHFTRAVQLDPGNAAAQYELGSLLLKEKKFAEATEHLRASLAAKPDSAPAHNDLGIALASMGDLRSAIDQFNAAIAVDPAFEEARANLASAARSRAR